MVATQGEAEFAVPMLPSFPSALEGEQALWK